MTTKTTRDPLARVGRSVRRDGVGCEFSVRGNPNRLQTDGYSLPEIGLERKDWVKSGEMGVDNRIALW